MKTTIISLLAILLLIGMVAEDLNAASVKGIALTLKVKGDVKIRKAGSDEKIPLKFGTRLDDGDWINTGPGGFVTIIFSDDKSMLKLRPKTEITINGKRDSQSNIAKRISLEVGQMLANVEQQRGTLEIATPTSVASVKGTRLWVVVFEDGKTLVFTMSGFVTLMNRFTGNIVEIKAGEVGESDAEGNLIITIANDEDIPVDPDDINPDDAEKSIKIDVKDDPEGRTRTIKLEYE